MIRYQNSRLAVTPESTLFIWVSLGANNDRSMYSKVVRYLIFDFNYYLTRKNTNHNIYIFK